MSVRGIDLSIINNRVKTFESIRESSTAVSGDRPNLGVNPDRDIYGRPTGLSVTSGGDSRAFRILEQQDVGTRPYTGGGERQKSALTSMNGHASDSRTQTEAKKAAQKTESFKPYNKKRHYTRSY